MKKFLLFLIPISQFLIFNSFSQSPDWLWAKAMGGTGHDYGNGMAIDASGNVYTTGSFIGTVDFDPGTGVFNLTSDVGTVDIFISKLDSAGNFVWAKAMGGTNLDQGYSIAIDPSGSGNVYTSGSFHGTVDFDPGVGIFNLTSAGNDDIFILRLDSSGNFEWAKTMGGIGVDYCLSMAIDAGGSGALYTTGSFQATVDFDPDTGIYNLTTAGFYDIFISKLDSSGNFVWAKAIGGTLGVIGQSISIDPASGDVYTTGYFDGTADFDPGPGTFNLTSAGWFDIFISKLDSSGNFEWAKTLSGSTGHEYGYSIAIDSGGSGGVYTTGLFWGTVDFDPSAGVFNITATVDYNVFICKLDRTGNFVWAKSMGGGTIGEHGSSIVIDPAGSGTLYTTGNFAGTADFDPGVGTFNLISAGYEDIFISILDTSGNFIWAKATGGTDEDWGKSIALDASGKVYVLGGIFSTSINFGSTTLTNAGGDDIFIAKLDSVLTIGDNEIKNPGQVVLIYPNPAITQLIFESGNWKIELIEIYDVLGQKVLCQQQAIPITIGSKQQITIDVSQLSSGIYFLQFTSAEKLHTEKVIIRK
jgi:hypothetical protein